MTITQKFYTKNVKKGVLDPETILVKNRIANAVDGFSLSNQQTQELDTYIKNIKVITGGVWKEEQGIVEGGSLPEYFYLPNISVNPTGTNTKVFNLGKDGSLGDGFFVGGDSTNMIETINGRKKFKFVASSSQYVQVSNLFTAPSELSVFLSFKLNSSSDFDVFRLGNVLHRNSPTLIKYWANVNLASVDVLKTQDLNWHQESIFQSDVNYIINYDRTLLDSGTTNLIDNVNGDVFWLGFGNLASNYLDGYISYFMLFKEDRNLLASKIESLLNQNDY